MASLLDKRINLDTYTTDMVERSEVQRMLKLVTVAEDSVRRPARPNGIRRMPWWMFN